VLVKPYILRRIDMLETIIIILLIFAGRLIWLERQGRQGRWGRQLVHILLVIVVVLFS
jgi:hypothetical protein